jgi:hypothetical protein
MVPSRPTIPVGRICAARALRAVRGSGTSIVLLPTVRKCLFGKFPLPHKLYQMVELLILKGMEGILIHSIKISAVTYWVGSPGSLCRGLLQQIGILHNSANHSNEPEDVALPGVAGHVGGSITSQCVRYLQIPVDIQFSCPDHMIIQKP